MARRTIKWTATADKQREKVIRYWMKRNKSPSYAIKLLKQSSAFTDLILENPEAFQETDYKNVRKAVMGNISLYYKITKEHIIIMAFWDQHQDPDKIKKIISK